MAPLRDGGAWTIWEALHRGIKGTGSLCHAWGTAPLDYMTRYVLGVREAAAGEPDRLVVDPRTTLDACRGVFPHPKGPVTVGWRRTAGGIEVEADGPAGVEVVGVVVGGRDNLTATPTA